MEIFQTSGVSASFLHRKRKLRVDLGKLKDERDCLASFLHLKLKVDITSSENGVWVYSEELSVQELTRFVNKFVYKRNLNNRYWVAMEGAAIKIHEFEGVKKHEKSKREKTKPSTIKHGW